MDSTLTSIDTLNSPTASTEEKLLAIEEMNEEGYTWWYDNGAYSVVDLENKPALLARE